MLYKWKERDEKDPRCSKVRCRHSWEIAWVAGATKANPEIRVQVCDKHLADWCEEWTHSSEIHSCY